MARLYRFDHQGAFHHVMTRGVEKRRIVLDDSDRDNLAFRLGRCSTETGIRVHAWVIMPNHLHILAETGDVPLSRFMHKLLTGYAVRFNRKYERVGHLFQGRYKSILVHKETYFIRLLRYIHRNPLEALITTSVDHLSNYRWSGHIGILDPAAYPWQARDMTTILFGKGIRGLERYLDYLNQSEEAGEDIFDVGNFFIGAEGIVERSTSSRPVPTKDKHLPILGDRQFSKDMMAQLNPLQGHPMKRDRSREHSLAMTFIRAVESFMGLSEGVLSKRGGGRTRAAAREIAAYALIDLLGMTLRDAAGIMGISRQGVSVSRERFLVDLDGNRLVYESLLANIKVILQQRS